MPENKSSRGKRLSVYLGLLTSLGCIVWLLRYVEEDEIFARVREVHPGYLIAAIIVTIISYILRAARWPLFFRDGAPGLYDSYRCLIIGFFMNNVLPARIGELVRAHVGGKATKQSRTIVLATIAGERLADGLMISLLFAVLFSVFSTPEESQHASQIFYVAYLFGAATLFTVLVIIFRARVFSLLQRLNRIMPGNLSTYTLVRVQRFVEGLAPMFKPSKARTIGAFSAVIWSVELLVYFLVAKAFSQELTIGALSLFLAAVNFSSLIPAAPGGIGVIEAFATLALVQLGLNREASLAMVAAQHIIQIAVVGVPGLFFFFSDLGGKIPESAEETGDEPEDVSGTGVQLGAKFTDISSPEDSSAGPSLPPAILAAELGQPQGKNELEFSIVIPAYNEELRLPSTLLSVVDYFNGRGVSYEIVVVDDGSSDKTAEVVQRFEHLSPHIRLLSYPENKGKGYAVRLGVLSAVGKLILFNDADGATPIVEIERLEEAIKAGEHIAIGSRAMYSRDTSIHALWYRRVMGRIFSAFVNFVVLPGVADTQCGFKLFLRPVARYLFARQKADGFSFDVEILFIARKSHCRIAEVPINWTNIPGSKVNLVTDSLRMLRDIVRFRARSLSGVYR